MVRDMAAGLARGAVVFGAVAALLYTSMPAWAAPVAWTDDATGFAIGGYDPVAYYAARKSVPGDSGVEHRWGGVTWRFKNTGNRAAFAMHPEVYAPEFAGYDAEALARGLTVEGNPAVFTVFNGRVLLFRDAASLRKWQENPARLTALAKANWVRLSRDIAGTSRY